MSANQRTSVPIIKSGSKVNLPPVHTGTASKIPVRISRFKSPFEKDNRAILPNKPSVHLPRVTEKNGKPRFFPRPPTTPKVNAIRKRPVPAKVVPIPQRNHKARNLSIVGKTVALKGEPKPACRMAKISSKVKSSSKLGEKTTKTSEDSKHPAEAELIPQDGRTLNKEKSFRSRIPRVSATASGVQIASLRECKSFTVLSAGSNIPVPVGNLKSSPRVKTVKHTSTVLDDNQCETNDVECATSDDITRRKADESSITTTGAKMDINYQHDDVITTVLASKDAPAVIEEMTVTSEDATIIMDIPEKDASEERPRSQIVHLRCATSDDITRRKADESATTTGAKMDINHQHGDGITTVPASTDAPDVIEEKAVTSEDVTGIMDIPQRDTSEERPRSEIVHLRCATSDDITRRKADDSAVTTTGTKMDINHQHDDGITTVPASKDAPDVIEEKAVTSEDATGIMDIPEKDASEKRPRSQVVHDKNGSRESISNKEVREALGDTPPIQPKMSIYQQRGKPVRLVMDIGKVDMKPTDSGELTHVDESPSLFGKFSTKFKKENPGFRKWRQMLPNKPNLDMKLGECPVERNRKFVSTVKATGLKREAVTPTVQLMMKEFEKIYSELFRVRNDTCDEGSSKDGGNVVNPFDSSPTGIPKRNPVAYVKELGVSMTNIIREIDDVVKTIKADTCDVVTTSQQDAQSTKKAGAQRLEERNEDIDVLHNAVHELECSLAEEQCKFASLESLINAVNSENEKLESRAQTFQKELEKARLEWNCKVRELTNLRSDIQRRDTRSSELLDEYSVLWKEKNSLSLNVACFEAEMQESSTKRLHLECHNAELLKQIEDLKKQVLENEAETVPTREIARNDLKRQNKEVSVNESLESEASREDLVQVYPVPETITVPVLPEDVFVYDEIQIQPDSYVDTDKINDMDIVQDPPIDITQPETLPEAVQRIHVLEMAIAERNLQLNEFMKIVDILKEKNTKLEIEKLEELNKMQGLRLESLQDAKQLREMEERVQTKDEVIDDLSKAMDVFMERYNRLLADQLASVENSEREEEKWIAQCKRSCQQTKEIEKCMKRQDAVLEDMKNERAKLIKENYRLRAKFGSAAIKDTKLREGCSNNEEGFFENVTGERNQIQPCQGEYELSKINSRHQRKMYVYQSDDMDMWDIRLKPHETMVYVVKDVRPKGRDAMRSRSSHIRLVDGAPVQASAGGNGGDLDGEIANLKHDNPSDDTLQVEPIKEKDSFTTLVNDHRKTRVKPKKRNKSLLVNFVRNLSPIEESPEKFTNAVTRDTDSGDEIVAKGDDEILTKEQKAESLKLNKRVAGLKKNYKARSSRLLKKFKGSKHRDI